MGGLIEEEEDLSVFTDNEFSTVAIVDSRGEQPFAPTIPFELVGLFDQLYEPMFDSHQVEGKNITFLVETALIGDLHHRDRLIIKGKNYLIKGIQAIEDGKLTSLILKEDLS